MLAKRKHSQASAAVVDGNLIISLPNAIDPVVWRMALGDARSSALEVKQRDNHYMLLLKTPRGDMNDIAPFSDKQNALDALMCISDAMQSAEGKINPVSVSAAASPNTQAPARSFSPLNGVKWIGALALVCLAVFMFTKLSSFAPVTYDDGQSAANTNATAMPGNTTAPGTQPSGVPVSADDMLSGF